MHEQEERALAIFFQHLGGDPSRLEGAFDRAAELTARHLSSSVTLREIVG